MTLKGTSAALNHKSLCRHSASTSTWCEIQHSQKRVNLACRTRGICSEENLDWHTCKHQPKCWILYFITNMHIKSAESVKNDCSKFQLQGN